MLYHYQIGLPKIEIPDVYGLRASAHALAQAASDRYGSFEIPTNFRKVDWKVIEMETENGPLVKVVARRKLDEMRDLVMVFIPSQRVIKTVWVNLASDRHRTLNRALYAIPTK